MNRTTQLTRSPMKRGKGFAPRAVGMNKVGKRGRENAKVNREKKAERERSGITSCELQLSAYCTPDNNLSFAHDRKRRHMGKWGSEERAANMRRSILACNFCHDEAELQGEAKMQPIIQDRIARREIAA